MANVVTTITNVRAILGGKIRECNLRLSEGRIQGILPSGDAYGKVIDARGMLALPGFIDTHTHGAWGISLTSAEAKDLRLLRDFYASHGVTTFLPTLSSADEETLLRACCAIRQAKTQLGVSQIAGIHLEGPFLAEEHCGDAPRDSLRPPSYPLYRRLQDASGGLIARVTLSPELPNAPHLTGRLASEGVRVSLGHSGATYEETMECIRAGASSVTHLFSHTTPISREEPGISAAALEQDVFCELICDKRCIPPALVRLAVKTKGLMRTVCATDSVFPTGLGEGLYRMGERTVVLRDGGLSHLEGGDWAGSILTCDAALRTFMEVTELPLEQSICVLTEAPARMLGISHRKGSLEVGKDADLILLDKQNRVRLTLSEGTVIYDSSEV